MRVCVIGTGVAGLSSLHFLSKSFPGCRLQAYEHTDSVGGTWVYSETTGDDKYGIPLMTSMYQNLRTNLPKEVMSFSDFPIPETYKSFMDDEEFLVYLKRYAHNFDLKKYIKFHHYVTLVKRVGCFWQVTAKDLVRNEENTEEFDYVFVCNGHYHHAFVPEYKGKELFKGTQIHSHNYRKPDPYKSRSVLVVGSGPSGLDISIDVANVSRLLLISHHAPAPIETPFPEHYHQRPDVKELTEHGVTYVDGTHDEVDDIIYCTGYGFSAPFLHESCCITIERSHMAPLYRHIVNIRHPTMFFIGVPQLCCAVPLMDVQVRYCILAMKGSFLLPSEEAMLQHTKEDYEVRKRLGFKKQHTHMLGGEEAKYYSEMAEESGVVPVPPVFCSIRMSTMETKKNLYTYRNYHYKVLDDYHFIRTYHEPQNPEGHGNALEDGKAGNEVMEQRHHQTTNDAMGNDMQQQSNLPMFSNKTQIQLQKPY